VGRRGPVIAIDGPSGVGKTTIARLVSQKLNFRYVDTGAMYRAIALGASEAGIDLDSDEELKRYCERVEIHFGEDNEIFLNKRNLTQKIREPKAGSLASKVSQKKPVRDFLVVLQKKLGECGNVVMEGRDIGSVVFPDAEVKIFLDASAEVRARRRHRELSVQEREGGGRLKATRLEAVVKGLKERDRRDSSRVYSPLMKAEDAIYVDTGELTVEEVVEKILNIVKVNLRREV
jgi:cytidylate kinase